MTEEERRCKEEYDRMSESEKRQVDENWARTRERLERRKRCDQWEEENPGWHDRNQFFGD